MVQKSDYKSKAASYESDIASNFVYLKTNGIQNAYISKIEKLFKDFFYSNGKERYLLKIKNKFFQ